MVGRLLRVDALDLRFSEIRLPRDPNCPGCGAGATFRGYADIARACGTEV